jgi:hypothetical protein
MRVYAAAVFLGAFLLLQIQPIAGKTLLPRFGGSAAVWATCLVFFQAALVAGYLYAHGLVRYLRPSVQRLAHACVLAASAAALWAGRGAASRSGTDGDPALAILAVLALSIGLPYFALSATSPLMQAWYAGAQGAGLPYRLYALSNLASLAGLLAYPILCEPFLTIRAQWRIWDALFAGFVVVCALAALAKPRRVESGAAAANGAAAPPSAEVQVLWLVLPACAAAMLLAVTNHLCRDVAPAPLLWVVPLAGYLATFVVCFGREDWYRAGAARWVALALLAAMETVTAVTRLNHSLPIAVPVLLAGLVACCFFCHGELVRLKPHPRYLTRFYLMAAAGGACGGLFVSLAAPRVYTSYFEMHVSMLGCALLAVFFLRGRGSRLFLPLAAVPLAVFAVLGAVLPLETGTRAQARSFYGVLRVFDQGAGRDAMRMLQHDGILHGGEFLDASRGRLPTMYFGPQSGIGLVLRRPAPAPRRIGVVGLGCGTLACYARPGDLIRFYEIDPLAERFARTQFKYLAESEGTVEIVTGDARLSLEREPPQSYDVLAIDAFSGDSIPLHLLTREAVALYFRHLRPTGVVAVHISNKFFNFAPVVASLAAAFGKPARLVRSAPDTKNGIAMADWALVPAATDYFAAPEWKRTAWLVTPPRGARVWTDDYSNLLGVLR